MKTPLLLCFLLVALVPFVFAEGQVILDEIRNVKADAVTFWDPLFTNYGVISTIVTDSFAATRQFELKVGVQSTYLTSQEGLTSFEASLGAIITSKTGDVSFQAEKDITLTGSVFNINALDLVSFESRHDLFFDSLYETSFTAGNIRAQATNSMIFATLGEIDFDAGGDLNFNTRASIFLSAVDIGLEAANGDIYLLAGAELSVVTSQLVIDGIHSVSVEAAGSLDFNTIDDVYFYTTTFDAFVDNDIVFDFDQIYVDSPDTTVFASSNIELDSDTSILVSGEYPESTVALDFATFLNITAASTISFKSTGESAPVYFLARDYHEFLIDDATTFSTLGSLAVGHNKTDTFTITVPTYTLASDYTNQRSSDNLFVTASNQILLDAAHIIFNGNGVKTISNTGQINSDSRDLYVITTPNSQTGSIISSGGNTAFTSKSLTLSGFAVDGNIQQTQTYTVGPLTINSNDGTNFDTTLKANSADLSLIVEDDIDISSSNFVITATDIEFNLLDYTLTADLYGLRTNTLSIDSTNDLSFTSGFNIAIEGDDMTLVSNTASTYHSQAAVLVGGEDITYNAGKNLFVTSSEYHIDVTALANWDLDQLLTLSVFDDVYLKTSDFQLIADRRMTWTITGDWTGSYGELTFTSTDDITYDTLDNGDIHVRSGGDLALNSDDEQTITVGDAIDMFAQEDIAFSSGLTSTFNSQGPIDIYGSEEFEFSAKSSFSVTATAIATYNADIITQHSDTVLNFHSSGNFDTTTGNYWMEANQDLTVTADNSLNVVTLDALSENLLEFNSPNFKFTGTGALTVRSSLNIDFDSQSSVIQSTNGLFQTQVANDMHFDVGSLSINAGTTVTSKSIKTTTYIAGYDDFVDFNANGRFLVTGAADNELIFDSETSILFDAKTSIDTLLELSIVLTSQDTTTIDANGILNVNADEDLYIQSAEDLSFVTLQEKNILITIGGDAKYTVGRDFNIISDGLDPLVSLNCSISVTTNDGDSTFDSFAGKLELNSWKTFEIRSFDSPAGDDGNIYIDSTGTQFWESYESGIIFIVDEDDARGINIITLEVYDGNQEYLSTLAGVKYLGYDGFDLDSDDFRVWAQQGITIISNDTSSPLVIPAIHFDVGDDAITSGARGLTIVAGLEAPIINEDYLLNTGNNLFIESQDLLNFFSLSTASLTAGAGNVVFTTYEGNSIDFSAGGDLISLARNSIEFSTEDGDQYYNSNSKSFFSTASSHVAIFTNDGPIELDSLGGQFNLIGADLEFESNMDTKITSLAFIQITAGDSLQLVGQDENKSGVLIKNQRDIDNIYINGNVINGAVSQIQDLTNLEYTNLETQVYGNNIDIITGQSAIFDSQQDSIYIGTDSLPLVKMTASATAAGTDAVTVTALNTLLVASANTITSVSDTVAFSSDEFNILSTGFIYLQTQTDDVTFEATTKDINIISEIITTNVVGSHTITGTTAGAGKILLASDGSDFGDRLEFDVSTTVSVADGSALFSTGNLFDLDIGRDLQISTDTFKIANNLGFDPTYVLPYYNFISYERQSISLDFDTLDSTITNQLSFTVGVDVGNVPPLFNLPELYIESKSYNLDTIDFTVANPNLNSNVQFGSVKGSNYQITDDTTFTLTKDASIYSIGNTQYTVTGAATLRAVTDSIFKIGGDTTFTYATSYDIAANGATGSQAVEFSSLENKLTVQTTTLDITNSVSPLGDPQYFNVEGGDISLNNAAGTFTINGLAKSDLIAFYGDFESTLGTLTVNANNLLYNATATTSDLFFSSGGDITLTTPLGKFLSSEYLAVETLVDIGATVTVSSLIQSSNGDVNVLGDDTISILPTVSALFEAFGYQPDNKRAITIDSDSAISFLPSTSLLIQTESTQTHYSGLVTLTSPIMSFTTTNYESPITLLIDNGNSQITGTTTVIEGGRSAQFLAAIGLTITATAAPVTLSTSFRRNGILFDTDLKQNFHSSTAFSSTGVTTVNARDMRFLVDRARGDLGVVQFKSGSSIALRTTGNDRPASFLSTAGNIEIASATSFIAAGDYIDFQGENQQITGAANTFMNVDSVYGQIKSLTGDIYGNAGTSGNAWSINTAATGSVTATTDGFGDNNDILLTSPSTVFVHSTAGNINIFGNNGDSAVIIESNTANTGFVNFFSTASDVAIDSLSGIQFVFTGHGPDGNGIVFNVGDDMFVTAWEKRGSIFFQSDIDTTMQASQSIRHTQISARLGFFSVTPQHIYTVGLQKNEGCVESGFCGNFGGHSTDYSASLDYLGQRVLTLQRILRQYGLIDWTQFMMPPPFP